MVKIEYLKDKKWHAKAVVMPIELWRRLVPKDDVSVQELSGGIEDYCLDKAMDEAKKTPLLNSKEALTYLEE